MQGRIGIGEREREGKGREGKGREGKGREGKREFEYVYVYVYEYAYVYVYEKRLRGYLRRVRIVGGDTRLGETGCRSIGEAA